MKTATEVLMFLAVLAFVGAPAVQGEVIWHDPWLNWDFMNQNPIGPTIVVNDFAIIVDAENWVPQEQWSAPFNVFATTQIDTDGDLITDATKCEWSGADIPIGAIAHGGLYMKGSGLVLDAYWTLNGIKQYISTPVTYEMTEIRGDPEVHMHLTIAEGYYKDPLNLYYPNAEAGWTNIRTFVNIPADALGLADLTRELDLDTLVATYGGMEVQPYYGKPGLPGNEGTPILLTDYIQNDPVPDSFFDVYLATIDPEFANAGYEALLHAEVWNQGNVVGEFWNLNPQSPEPGTMALLVLGGLGMILRRRKR